ncbi:MAG: hypothetical protein QM496_12120 [Verrucomicrobiota bacterium]
MAYQKKNITEPGGLIVGHVDYDDACSEKDFERRFRNHISKLPSSYKPPFGVFEDLEVKKEHRGNDYSRIGIKDVDTYFQNAGVKGAILRVAPAESTTEGWSVTLKKIKWLIKLYESVGWSLLPRDDSKKYSEPYLMVKEY